MMTQLSTKVFAVLLISLAIPKAAICGEESEQVRRFQMVANPNPDAKFGFWILDTQTGQVWREHATDLCRQPWRLAVRAGSTHPEVSSDDAGDERPSIDVKTARQIQARLADETSGIEARRRLKQYVEVTRRHGLHAVDEMVPMWLASQSESELRETLAKLPDAARQKLRQLYHENLITEVKEESRSVQGSANQRTSRGSIGTAVQPNVRPPRQIRDPAESEAIFDFSTSKAD